MRSSFAVCPARERAFRKRQFPFTSYLSTYMYANSNYHMVHLG
jgi:hypothetical protein